MKIEIDIIKIFVQVFRYFPLIMGLILIIDYEINNKYNLDIEVIDFEERKNKDNLIIRIIEKLNDLVNGNNE